MTDVHNTVNEGAKVSAGLTDGVKNRSKAPLVNYPRATEMTEKGLLSKLDGNGL